jgi:hypothetical protein
MQANFFDALFLDSLNAPRTTTVFAPTDEAFAMFSNETITRLLNPAWSFHLRELLRYHLVDGTINGEELGMLEAVTTLTNFNLTVSEPTNQDDEQLKEMFCGDLDFVEVSVPKQWQTNDDSSMDAEEEDQGMAAAGLLEFRLLLEEGKTVDAYKEVKDNYQQILKAIQEQFDLDQQDTSNEAHYSKMNTILQPTDTENSAHMDLQGRCKRKQKSKASLMDFTSSTKKSKKGSNEIKGWTNAGKLYVMEMLKAIKQDEDSGICKKWDGMYKTLCNAVKDGKDKDEDEVESKQHFCGPKCFVQ